MGGRVVHHPYASLGLLLAGWPVILWMIRRWIASPDEHWHLLPVLLLALAIWLRRRQRTQRAEQADPDDTATLLTVPGLAFVLLWLYIASLSFASPLLQALCLASTLGAVLSYQVWGRVLAPGVWGCLLLAVPTLPSVHFFLGYPWRRGTTLATAELLHLSGLSVVADGTQLRWAGGVVAVDAPCSGLYMSWVVAVFVVALWLFNDAGVRRSVVSGIAALGLVLVTNVLRAAALFFLESGYLPSSFRQHPWHHDAVGLLLFVPLCLILAAWLMRPAGPARQTPSPPTEQPVVRRTPRSSATRVPIAWTLGLLTALLLPWWVDGRPQTPSVDAFPGWPTRFEGRPLTPLSLTPREARFAEDFPGRLGRFHDGKREIILRWVAWPTRRLHPAAQCFRAHGHRITHRPLKIDLEGRPWSSFLAHGGNSPTSSNLQVFESIRDADGNQWPDVSAWYWAAVLGQSRGPWWSTVVAEGPPSPRDTSLLTDP